MSKVHKRKRRLPRYLLGKKVEELTSEEKQLLRKWFETHKSEKSIAMDLSRQAKRIPKYVSTWVHHTERYDIPGVDTVEVEARKKKTKRPKIDINKRVKVKLSFNVFEKHFPFIILPNGQVIRVYKFNEVGINGEYGKRVKVGAESEYELNVPIGTIIVLDRDITGGKKYESLIEANKNSKITIPNPEYYIVLGENKLKKLDYKTEEKILGKSSDSKLVMIYHILDTPYGKVKIPFKIYPIGRLAYNIRKAYYPFLNTYLIKDLMKKFEKGKKHEILDVIVTRYGIEILPVDKNVEDKIVEELKKKDIPFYVSNFTEWVSTDKDKYTPEAYRYINITPYAFYKYGKDILEILEKHGLNNKEIMELKKRANDHYEYIIPFYKLGEYYLKKDLGEYYDKVKIDDIDVFNSWKGSSITIKIRGYNKLPKEIRERIKDYREVIDRKGEGIAKITYRVPYSSIDDFPVSLKLMLFNTQRFEKLYNDIKKRNKELTKDELISILDEIEDKLKDYKRFYQYLLSGEYDKLRQFIKRLEEKELLDFGYWTKDYDYKELDEKSKKIVIDTIINEYKKVIEEAKKNNKLIREILSDKKVLKAINDTILDYKDLINRMKDVTRDEPDILVDYSHVVGVTLGDYIEKYFRDNYRESKPISIHDLVKKDNVYIVRGNEKFGYYKDNIEPILKVKPDEIRYLENGPLFMRKGNVYFIIAPITL